MKVRFQADNDLRAAIVRGILRSHPGIDFRSAQSAKLDSVPDLEVLSIAQRDGRILVSHDLQTMPSAFREFTKQTISPGVFLIPQDLPVGRAVESLLLVWEASSPQDWQNRLCLIPSLVALHIAGPA
jgi:hypothetical protein